MTDLKFIFLILFLCGVTAAHSFKHNKILKEIKDLQELSSICTYPEQHSQDIPYLEKQETPLKI